MESGTLEEKMAGVFAPISTPFADDESLDLDGLRFNLERYAQTGLLGYLALGSNGENRSLTEEEKLQVLDTIVRHKGRGQVVMAGATYDAQRDTERFLRQAADLGADFGLVLSPGYFRKQMTDDVLYRYFATRRRFVAAPASALQRTRLLRRHALAGARRPSGRASEHRRDERQRRERHRELPPVRERVVPRARRLGELPARRRCWAARLAARSRSPTPSPRCRWSCFAAGRRAMKPAAFPCRIGSRASTRPSPAITASRVSRPR